MFSTREAAKKLGLGFKTLSRYIAVGKVPAPTILRVGSASLHAWTDEEIEHARQLLPKIANGRKTRYQKKQVAISTQQSAKPKAKNKVKNQKPPSWAAVPRKKKTKATSKP
jgi:predicted DNA-binding transcriptional regulator AlpA